MKPNHGHMSSSAVSTDLKVRVDRIGDDGLDLDEVLSTEWLKNALGEGTPFHPTRDGHLVVRLDKVDDIVRLRGRSTVHLAGECARCLVPVDLAIDVPVDLVMFPSGHEPSAADAEGELTDDDMGVSSYDDGVLDLASIVHDEVFLELPISPLCSETCAGLCPTCGANRNEAPCGCAPAVDPRWQALLDLKAD